MKMGSFNPLQIYNHIKDYYILPLHDKDILNDFNYSFNEYMQKYYSKYNERVDNPEIKQIGLINVFNDCYIISFLQILIHTPNFLNILKKIKSYREIDEIIKYLILVSEYPYNIQYLFNLKKSFGKINPEYSKYQANDSQEFGIDLINYIINQLKYPVDENDEDDFRNFEFINNDSKKIIFEKYFSGQKKMNELENLFLFNETQIFCSLKNKKISISPNLHIELTLQKTMNNNLTIENLLYDKYNMEIDNFDKPNQILIKSQLVTLPKILIITINRLLIGEKINNSILEFREILDLAQFIDKDLFNDQNKNTKYHLYAINKCIHQKKNNHYLCSIKINNKWYLFNDKKVDNIKYPDIIALDSVVGLFYIRDN